MSIDPAFMIIKSGSKPSRSRSYILHFALSTIYIYIYIYKPNIGDTTGNISTDVYQKPTETHPYLHWTSAHPPHLKYSIPYSQALRLRRICSSTGTLKQRTREYSNFFVACGYQKGRVLAEMRKVLSITHTPGNDIQPAYHIYCGDS